MDRTNDYANILTETLYAESQMQFRLQPELKLVAACDHKTGQFFLVMVGWDKDDWIHSILFHAQLIGSKLVIEADLTETVIPQLLEAGIRAEDFLDVPDYPESQTTYAAAA